MLSSTLLLEQEDDYPFPSTSRLKILDFQHQEQQDAYCISIGNRDDITFMLMNNVEEYLYIQ
jgi:hypothetical protein